MHAAAVRKEGRYLVYIPENTCVTGDCRHVRLALHAVSFTDPLQACCQLCGCIASVLDWLPSCALAQAALLGAVCARNATELRFCSSLASSGASLWCIVCHGWHVMQRRIMHGGMISQCASSKPHQAPALPKTFFSRAKSSCSKSAGHGHGIRSSIKPSTRQSPTCAI